MNLGRTGLKVSRICLGTLTFGSPKWRPYMLAEEESRSIIERALELGINFFDTADMYSLGVSEEILGRALNDLVKSGRVRYLGASSMYAWQLAKMLFTADRHGWHRFVSMQNHYNLIYREEEREMIPLCQDQGLGLIPWSPLARGFLAGNHHRDGGGKTVRAKNDTLADEMYYRPSDFSVVERVKVVAERHGVSPAQVSLAWLLHQPGVVAPIVGVRRIRHLEEAVNALEISLPE